MICNGLVIAIGNGRAVCADLKTGRTAWTDKAPTGNSAASPSADDGKDFYDPQTDRSFIMLKATAGNCSLLAETKGLGVAPCSSPTIVVKRLYLRLKDGVACFDLSAPPAKAGSGPDAE